MPQEPEEEEAKPKPNERKRAAASSSDDPDPNKRQKGDSSQTAPPLPVGKAKVSEKEVVEVIHASPKMSIKQLIAKFKEFLNDKAEKAQFMGIVKVAWAEGRARRKGLWVDAANGG